MAGSSDVIGAASGWLVTSDRDGWYRWSAWGPGGNEHGLVAARGAAEALARASCKRLAKWTAPAFVQFLQEDDVPEVDGSGYARTSRPRLRAIEGAGEGSTEARPVLRPIEGGGDQ